MNKAVRPSPENFLDWKEREALAEGMIPIINESYIENQMYLVTCMVKVWSINLSHLMKSHRFVRQVEKNELSEFDTAPMLQTISNLQLGPAHIDIGKLVVKYQALNQPLSHEEFVDLELAVCIGSNLKPLLKPQDIVLYGFGRIGRLLARLLLTRRGRRCS